MADGRPHEVPVLIAGAGPAGLAAAIALSRYGVECLLVERRRELMKLPRSTGISTRTMELLRSWGLEEEVRAGGVVESEWMHWICQTLATAPQGHGYPTGYPTQEQCAVISPVTPACVPQDHLEPVMLDHLRSLEVGRVELGTELTSVENGADLVRIGLRDVGGDERIVEARYLIGADGAHSAVRRALGIEMRGSDQLVEAVTTLFRAPLWGLVPEHRFGIYMIMHPEAEGALRPTGKDDRWDYVVMFESGTNAAELAEEDLARKRHLYRRAWFGGLRVADLTEKGLAERIRLAVGVPDLEPRIERIAGYSFAAQVAERFRSGNAFLVGDAAHRSTPRGGTGMNSAFQDAYDVGWKLAWVLHGWADPALLDAYEAERRPVDEHNVALSADSRRLFREPGQELPADIGGRIRHAWTAPVGEPDRASTLDLLGPGLTLFTGPEPAGWEAEAAALGTRLPVDVRRLDAIVARAIGVPAGGALLARPDGTPAGTVTPGMDIGGALRATAADPTLAPAVGVTA